MNEYRNGLGDQIPAMARDFFATFARFEFALKRGGYLKGKIGEGAEPHWDDFANALGVAFFDAMRASPHAEIFFVEPPMKLIRVSATGVQFIRTADVASAADLLALVRRVRNNLFHGEKLWFDDRDRLLVEAALFVLDSAFQAASTNEKLRPVADAFYHARINRS